MRTACMIAAALAAVVASAAAAQVVADKPTDKNSASFAEVKVFSASRQKAVWSGEGSSQIVTDLCVASSTGRFLLQITSQGGGAMTGPGKLPYVIHFRDGAGLDHVQRVNGQSLITIEGSAPNVSGCDAGANASLEIENVEGDMLGKTAGEYFDRLTLSATPL